MNNCELHELLFGLLSHTLCSIEILLLMKQAGNRDYTQAILNILNPPLNEQHQGRGDRTPLNETVESSVIQALLSLRTQRNFQHVISISNDYSQTLVHLSVLYGFKTLLKHLLDWSAELGVADSNGLTALHCAYLAGDLESILLLRRGGASMYTQDKLGRLPLDFWPGGPDSASEVEAAIAAKLENGPPMTHNNTDEQVVLSAQFDALDDECYGGNDSGDGGSNSDEDDPNDLQDDHDPHTMAISTSTSYLGPSTSKETKLETMNQWPQSRRKGKNRSPRIIPDTSQPKSPTVPSTRAQDLASPPPHAVPSTFNVVAKRTRDRSSPRRHTHKKFSHHNAPAIPAASCSGWPSSPDPLSSGSARGLGNLSGTSQPDNPTVPPANPQDLASPAPHADLFHPVGISAPPASVEDPMDGQNAVIEGTNPGRGPTTGGIEIYIYGTNLPNSSTPLYARFGENVTRVVSPSELLRVPGSNLVLSRTPFSLAYYPVSCRLETVRAGFRSPFREDPPPTLLLLEKVSATLNITSTATKRKPGVFPLFA